VLDRINEGDEQAALIFEAMVRQTVNLEQINTIEEKIFYE
jgi:hypothetical protein